MQQDLLHECDVYHVDICLINHPAGIVPATNDLYCNPLHNSLS